MRKYILFKKLQEHFIAVGLFFSSRRIAFNDIVNLSLEDGIIPADMKPAKMNCYLLKLCMSVIHFIIRR